MPVYSPAIFIDRDGVIIENRANYVRSWDDVQIYPQALQALASAHLSSYKMVIVTNQAAIGKGVLTLESAQEINCRLIQKIEENGGRVDGIYMCPHLEEDGCTCRKPKPGLLLRASHEMSIDLSRSIMIGDALSDIQAGKNAGVEKTCLLNTGRGWDQGQLSEAATLEPFFVFPDLKAAIAALISTTD